MRRVWWLFFFVLVIHRDWWSINFIFYLLPFTLFSAIYVLSAQKSTAARIIRSRIQLALCSRCHAFKFGGEKNVFSSSRYLLAIKDTMWLQTRMTYHDGEATLRVTFWYCNVVRINPFIRARGCSTRRRDSIYFRYYDIAELSSYNDLYCDSDRRDMSTWKCNDFFNAYSNYSFFTSYETISHHSRPRAIFCSHIWGYV
jgi:hypothetical protein